MTTEEPELLKRNMIDGLRSGLLPGFALGACIGWYAHPLIAENIPFGRPGAIVVGLCIGLVLGPVAGLFGGVFGGAGIGAFVTGATCALWVFLMTSFS